MKLLQELNELASVQQAIKGIGNECRQFLSNPFELYRGIRDDVTIQKMSIRQDRQPLDTDHLASGLFNFLFEKQTGVKNIRMRSMFCTGDRRQAKTYGAVSWVFPVDGSEIWARPGMRDSRIIVDRTIRSESNAIRDSDIRKAMAESNVPVYSGEFYQYIEQHGSEHAQRALELIAANTRGTFAEYKKIGPAEIKELPESTEIMVVGAAYYAANEIWTQKALSISYEDIAFKQLISTIKKTVP